jgi:ketosteroid isomerase-like protein
MEVTGMSPFVLLGSLLQLASGGDSCPSRPEALKSVAHDFWLGYNQRDTSLLARVLDDDLVLVPAAGTVTTKPELLAHITAPLEPMRSRSEERLDEARTVFAGETALLNFRRRWTVTHQPSGVSFKATSRMTEVFVCRGSEWKVLAFQETVMPNAERPVSPAASAHYGNYVGRYRFGSRGDGALIVVTRKGDTLYEAWGADAPVELLPGKFDAFFTRGFSIEEQFVRDAHGQVVGIVYSMGDSEIEARRVP